MRIKDLWIKNRHDKFDYSCAAVGRHFNYKDFQRRIKFELLQLKFDTLVEAQILNIHTRTAQWPINFQAEDNNIHSERNQPWASTVITNLDPNMLFHEFNMNLSNSLQLHREVDQSSAGPSRAKFLVEYFQAFHLLHEAACGNSNDEGNVPRKRTRHQMLKLRHYKSLSCQIPQREPKNASSRVLYEQIPNISKL